jgi:hypothetical protein
MKKGACHGSIPEHTRSSNRTLSNASISTPAHQSPGLRENLATIAEVDDKLDNAPAFSGAKTGMQD